MKIRRWGPVLAWMLLIFLLSSRSQFPSPPQPWLDSILEKIAHTLEYAVLAALLVRALEPSGSNRWPLFGLAVVLSGVYALSDEFHQLFVPGRAADWLDIFFDWLGSLLGARLWLYVLDVRQKKILIKDV